MINVKLSYRTAIYPQSLNVVTNVQIYDERYQDLVNKREYMKKRWDIHKSIKQLE